MRKLLLALFLSIPLFASAQNIDLDKWTKDIEYLRTELPRHHPDLFQKNNRAYWNDQLDKISRSINGRTNLELALDLQCLIASMGDDHTNLDFTAYLRGTAKFPFKYNAFADGYFILATTEDHKALLGRRITAINKVPMDTIIKRISHITGKVNEGFIRLRATNFLSETGVLKYCGVLTKDEAEFTYVTDDGGEATIKVSALPYGQTVKPVNFGLNSMPLYLQNQSSAFWYTFLEDRGILYVQYNVCDSKEVQLKLGAKQRAEKLYSFNDFTDSVIKVLNRPGVKKLVLDVRLNPGGSSQQGTEMAKKIAAQTSFNQKGKTYVITGYRTYSAALINAVDFKQKCNAIIVGETPAGKPNHFGQTEKLNLPGTNMALTCATKMLRIVEKDDEDLKPDFSIETSFANFAESHDMPLEFIEKYNP